MRSCWDHIMYPTRVYSTIVSVKIADTRLARLNCVCNAAILIYVFLYTIGYQNRHLEFGDISGTTMFMLKRPTEHRCARNECLRVVACKRHGPHQHPEQLPASGRSGVL